MKAFITGANGQDGYYLTKLLLGKGYKVFALIRPSTTNNLENIKVLCSNQNLKLVYGDLIDKTGIKSILFDVKPDEIYNLAAQSHVYNSFESPEYTTLVNSIGVLNILESIRDLGLEKSVRFYQASTSELFGKIQDPIQTEKTRFYPRSPYAISKLYSYWITINYREAYNLHASNGILFNHESPKRGKSFVTRKISESVAMIAKGRLEYFKLGNLDAKRDWGHAEDYTYGMWLMLQQEVPDDYVLATGETHSVRSFVELAFKVVNIQIEWKGKKTNEIGINTSNGKTLVKVSDKYYRPSEVDVLVGDYTKAYNILDWKPKVSFEELVKDMVKSDLKRIN